MKKSTKGAVAAGGAAVLLLGGAGSLAFWTDSKTLDGGAIAAGNMSMTAPDCSAGWVYADSEAGAGTKVTAIVPGDVVSEECTFTVSGSGDNLSATLDTPTSIAYTASKTGTTLKATVGATYAIGTTQLDTGATGSATLRAPDDFNKTVTATITVAFPYGDTTAVNDNDIQDVTATLNSIAITLTQSNPNA